MGVRRKGGKWSNGEWGGLWSSDLRLLHAVGPLASLPLARVLRQYVALLLRAGKVDLARPWLSASATGPGAAEKSASCAGDPCCC